MTVHYQIRLLSVIIPVGSRRSDLKTLYAEYKTGLESLDMPYEIAFVLDGRRPDAARALEELQQAGEAITIISLTRCFGEAAALMAGFERANGNAILTLPAYHQVEAIDLRKLISALTNADVAIGYRFPRAGNAIERVRRAAFHGMVNFVTGSRYQDLGCGVRALRRQVFEELDLYGDQHRFIAILASRLGFRITEVALRQSAKDRHSRVYRPREYLHQILDLVSIFFLVRFTKKPLRFFGMIGAVTFSIGALLITYLGIERLAFHEQLADRPALLLAALLIVLGMQIFALGLLGELIIFTHARSMKDYRVEEVIQYSDADEVSAEDKPESASEDGRNSGVVRAAPAAMA